MGIQGLLPLLKSIMVPIHIKDLSGCCVAVDTYSWLHKGALSCSKELCKGEPTTRHIVYCMHRVNLLRHHGVKPILVFDGGLLPMKGEQEIKRARARKENLERAIEHESTGNSAAAYECYQKAVDISPSIANELIQVLKQENVDYIVAPYEADAQMTFLALTKQVDAVITEDSDLIPFGCPRIVFKMDKFGQGVQFQYSMLQQNKELNFAGFTKQMLLEMCILSGCDYLQSLPGMGLKRAHALICKFKSYEKVIKHLRYSTVSVPPLYEESFKKALWTFQHQRVYDPMHEDIVHLLDITDDLGAELEFLGPLIPRDIAQGIAKGDIDAITKAPFQGNNAFTGLVLDRNPKLKGFRSEKERKKITLPAQKNVLTNYFCSASLEAKRRFKAPRTMLKSLGSNEESSPSSEGNGSEEFINFSMNYSQSSVLDSGNFSSSSPLDSSLEDGFATDVFPPFDSPCEMELKGMNGGAEDLKCVRHSVLQQSEHELHKPCMTLHKKQERHSVLQQSEHELHKPCMTLHKKQESKSAPDRIEEKTRPVNNRRVIVRSSYFQHKFLKENDLENKNDKLITENDVDNDVFRDKTTTKTASNRTNYIKGTIRKKTPISSEGNQTESVEVKRARKDEPLSSNSNGVADIDSKSMPVEMSTGEGKFGCNISHLGHYADVAEKSMERFISVISSFRCGSSGSRASGLRAPLKDIRNTIAIKPTISSSTNLDEFSYVPTNQKITR